MSDIREQNPSTAGATRVPPPTGQVPETTVWAGWILFGSMMMILLGAFQAIAGVVALVNQGFYLVTSSGLVIDLDYTVWGWIHVGVGAVAVAAGFGLITGAMWARVAGVAVALLSAIVNLAFLGAYPVWGVLMIALDVIVIYAITAHGSEVSALE
ncbi:MAG TPA: hypothetical protein VF049_11710 [Nocardioidaceae bacterium]|jgi:hypothetical protein